MHRTRLHFAHIPLLFDFDLTLAADSVNAVLDAVEEMAPEHRVDAIGEPNYRL